MTPYGRKKAVMRKKIEIVVSTKTILAGNQPAKTKESF